MTESSLLKTLRPYEGEQGEARQGIQSPARQLSVPRSVNFHWPMEETSGNRVDAIQGLPMIASPAGLDSEAGKIVDAAHLVQGTASLASQSLATGALPESDYPLFNPVHGWELCFWWKFKAFGSYGDDAGFTGNRSDAQMNFILNTGGISAGAQLKFTGPLNIFLTGTDHYNNVFFGRPGSVFSVNMPFTEETDRWYFFRCIYKATTRLYGLQIDDGPVAWADQPIRVANFTDFQLSFAAPHLNLAAPDSPSAVREEIVLDEVTWVVGRNLKPSEVAFLWNGGAGRTWPF